jgi:penicillin amidase
MLAWLLALSIQQAPIPTITRDDYGVPIIREQFWGDAFYDAGYATAQDRMWQMEMSRRLARGQLAEVFGHSMAASDKEVLASGYNDAELEAQFNALSPKIQAAFESYASGVNTYIHEATAKHLLPPGYEKNGFEPRYWTVNDSVAISIRLLQLFGRGGAGALRNLAVLSYLESQPKVKGHALDVFNDLAWQNDQSAITTLPKGEDPQADNPPLKADFTKAETEAQLNALPKLSLFELLPAIQLAQRSTSKLLAERVNVPFRTGSYCIVVTPQHSATGYPLLLSGPQMGHSNPAIIHEISMDAPGVHVTGMDVPGTPGIVIGVTPNLAWGLTSGVADCEDIFDFKDDGDEAYLYDGKRLPIQTYRFPLKVKGEPDQTVTQLRTIFGPVVLHARGHFFVRRSAFFGQELSTVETYYRLYDAKTPDEVERAASTSTMSFNLFYATTEGHCGWIYSGKMPIRAPGLDPRFPTPATPADDWRGFLTFQQKPHIRDPKAGFLANWNNKPAAWWPNYDTPVWGKIFHNEVLLDQIQKPKLTSQDLELAAWNIARIDETAKYFMPFARLIRSNPEDGAALAYLKAYDGRLMAGSISATIYRTWFKALRSELLEGMIGNFYSPDLFEIAAQPTLVLRALEGKTATNFLGGRSVGDVASAAFRHAVESLTKVNGPDMDNWGFTPGGFAVPGQAPVPYSNRGSYIQVVELAPVPYGRNVVAPGQSEDGPHSQDQVPLARAWTYKKMHPHVNGKP